MPADRISAAGGRTETSVGRRFVGKAVACQYLFICGTEIKAQGRVEI
jgi:hypothetical protein